MAEFPVNPQRVDPYKNFKFRVKWDGKYVAAICRVSGLLRTTDVVEHREGGDPSTSHKSSGETKYSSIVMERGLTQDDAFEAWANQVWRLGAPLGTEAALKDFRKDIVVELYNEAGQLVRAYKIYRCWPSSYEALPVLDANAVSVAIESLTIENEGWERDTSVAEPVEPA